MTTIPAPRCDPMCDLTAKVDAVHRYWLREFGAYPSGEDSLTIIGVIAALDEMTSPHDTKESTR